MNQSLTESAKKDTMANDDFIPSLSDMMKDELDYIHKRRKTILERVKEKHKLRKEGNSENKTDADEESKNEILSTRIVHKNQCELREKVLSYNSERRTTNLKNFEDHCTEKNKEENEKSNDELKKNLWGITFSGGGIRSATFCLGAVQALTKAGVFKYFDYMCTVSGGGYMGSCITSVLQEEDTGVDADDSPFVGLNDGTALFDVQKTRMSVRNQIHHLRAHGNYLATESGILNRDILRFVGTFIFGSVYHICLFTVLAFALVAGLLFYVQPFIAANHAVPDCNDSTIHVTFHRDNFARLGFTETNNLPFSAQPAIIEKHIVGWYDSAFSPAAHRIIPDFIDDRVEYRKRENAHYANESEHKHGGERKSKIFAFILSFILGIVCILISLSIAYFRKKTAIEYIADQEKYQKQPTPELLKKLYERIIKAKSGRTIQDDIEYSFAERYVLYSTIATLLISLIIAFTFKHMPELLFLPVAFSLGAFIITLLITLIVESRTSPHRRVTRSFYSILKGASFFGLLASVLLPFLFIFIFSLSYFSFTFYVSVIAALISGYLFKKNNSGEVLPKILTKFYKPLANTFVVLLFLFIIPPIAKIILACSEFLIWNSINLYDFTPLFFAVSCTIFLIIITMFIDSNKISAHAFYRDRLTETYLMTNARTKRKAKYEQGMKQGHPFLTVRNNETLRFKEIKKDKPKSPYHIIVTALNLRNNDETLRKSLKSEHFIFTPHWIGSEYTGYVRSNVYNGGRMQLSTAMTISGAAFNSLVGFQTFFAQSLFATLLNVRLGYWLPNPWFYTAKKKPDTGKRVWMKYLLKEMMGKTSADSKLVYLSDGGHTGDNLGILPLLQRRCKIIFIVDAEQDKSYTFDYFNTGLHLAYVEENISVEIDLSNIIRQNKDYPELLLQKQSFAIGTIYYPKTETHESSEGLIVYLKSSCSIYDNSENDTETFNNHNPNIEAVRKAIEQFPIDIAVNEIPTFVENYNRKHADFPHQSTVDQFFDPEQFGAYRALGEHVAWQTLYALAKDTMKNKTNGNNHQS